MSAVKIHVHGSTGTIMLNRPDKRNALNRELLADLTQALDDLRMQRSARSVVLTGSGSAFCAGLDLGEMHATLGDPAAYQTWEADARAFRDLLDVMLRFPKPVIAAVDGPALGAGFGLVLACDLVVASQQATFGLPEARRGLAAGIVAPLLAFRLGGARAAQFLITAEAVDGSRAYDLGIAYELTESETIWARANELAEQCAASAAESLQMSKKLLNETIAEHLQILLSAGTAVSSMSRTTEAAAEGLTAFVEKRPPKWP